MAIDAKVSLQQQIEAKMMTEVTADVMNRTLRNGRTAARRFLRTGSDSG